jgi:hypothetical protein
MSLADILEPSVSDNSISENKSDCGAGGELEELPLESMVFRAVSGEELR